MRYLYSLVLALFFSASFSLTHAQTRGFASSPMGLWVVNGGDDTISLLNVFDGTVGHTIPTPVPTHRPGAGGPDALAYDGVGLFFVSGNASVEGEADVVNHTVYILDPATGAVLGTIVLPPHPTGSGRDHAYDALAFGEIGGTPYLFANQPATQTIVVVDLSTSPPSVASTLTLGFQGIGGMGFNPHSGTLFITESSTQDIYEVDPATGTGTLMFSMPTADGGLLGVDFAGNKMFIASNHSGDILELNPVTGHVVNRFPAPTTTPSALAGFPGTPSGGFDCRADLLFVVNSSTSTYSILDPNTGAELNRFFTPVASFPPSTTLGAPDGLAFDGNYLFFISGDHPDPVTSETIYVVDPCTGAVMGSFMPPWPTPPAGSDPTIDALGFGYVGSVGRPVLFAMRPDGNHLFAIDLSTGGIFAQWTAGADIIGGLGFNGFDGHLYVSNFNATPSEMHVTMPGTGAVASTWTMPAGDLLGVDFVGGRLFGALDDGSGVIHEFDPSTGGSINSFASPDVIPSALAGKPGRPGPGRLAIELNPRTSPVIIPSGGGRYQFNWVVSNNSSRRQRVRVWFEIQKPDGAVLLRRGPLRGALGAGSSVTGRVRQRIPGGVAAGTYMQSGYITRARNTGIPDGMDFFVWEKAVSKGVVGDVISDWDTDIESDGLTLDGNLEGTAPAVPDDYVLAQNYPNPFNPETVIRYGLPEAGVVQLRVYNVLGQEVARLVDGFQAAGQHEARFDAAGLSAGTYLYVLEAEGFRQARHMVLLK